MKVKIKIYFLKLCQVWCVAVSSQIETFCAANSAIALGSTWNWPDSVGGPSQKQAIKTAESHSPTSQITVKILETSPPTWKRMIRPTETPGKDTLQLVALPVSCAVCSRFPLMSCHLCWGGPMVIWLSVVVSAPVSNPNTPNKSHWFNNQALVRLFLWSVKGSLSGVSRCVLGLPRKSL